MAQVKNKTKRCEMCEDWLERELKDVSLCDSCLELVAKYKQLWRTTNGKCDNVYRNGDLLRG